MHRPEAERRAFGDRVTRARLELGARQHPPRPVTQTEIAEAMGVVQSTVGMWEAGRKIPDLATVYRLATVLGVRAAWLAFSEEPMRYGHAAGPTNNEKQA